MLFTLNNSATVSTIHTEYETTIGQAIHKMAKDSNVISFTFGTDLGEYTYSREDGITSANYHSSAVEVDQFFSKLLPILVDCVANPLAYTQGESLDSSHYLMQVYVTDYHTEWALYNPITDILYGYMEGPDVDDSLVSTTTQYSLSDVSKEDIVQCLSVSDWVRTLARELPDYDITVAQAIADVEQSIWEGWDDLPF